MEIFLSALVGEVASRSINFFVNKISKQKEHQDVEASLQRVLLRALVIINEATGRHITNEAMLQQLDMLREAMYQGNCILDTFRYQFETMEDAKDPFVSHSLSLSKINSLKGICSSNRKTIKLEQLQLALENLSSMILDVKEMVVFLMSYPRLYRQPYSMHLLLSNCMFGRQMEAHFVINFLLNTQPCGSEELEVLPIVGPYLVGKSTLISHVCKDERIRDHFSEILLLNIHDFTNYDLSALSKGCAMEYQNHVLTSNKDRRLLVVEFVGDINEDEWNKLFSFYKQHVPRGSKIIVTSRSDKIIKFGTTSPLHLKCLSREAFWYFFRTLTFQSMDPKIHPKFAHMAMEIAWMQSVCFISANSVASLLRNNFNIHFWCKVLTFIRRLIQKNVSKYGGHPFDLINQNRPAHLWRMAEPSEVLVIHGRCQRSSVEDDITKISIHDVLYGNIKPHGKFEFVSWISQIPPYYSYVTCCEITEQKTIGTKRKHSTN